MPNAEVNIRATVMSKKRQDDEPFRPWITWNDSFSLVTDLENYLTVTPTLATDVYNYVATQRLSGAENTVHFEIRLDNVTHPTPAAGVVPLAKGNRSCAMSDLEVVSADAVATQVNDAIATLQTVARY